MRLTLKLVSVLTLLAVVLVGVNGYLTVQREVALFKAEMRANHQRLATVMEEMVVQFWQVTGEGRTLESITRLEPPLRSRGADVLLIAQDYIERFAAQPQKEIAGFRQRSQERRHPKRHA